MENLRFFDYVKGLKSDNKTRESLPSLSSTPSWGQKLCLCVLSRLWLIALSEQHRRRTKMMRTFAFALAQCPPRRRGSPQASVSRKG